MMSVFLLISNAVEEWKMKQSETTKNVNIYILYILCKYIVKYKMLGIQCYRNPRGFNNLWNIDFTPYHLIKIHYSNKMAIENDKQPSAKQKHYWYRFRISMYIDGFGYILREILYLCICYLYLADTNPIFF